MICGDMVKVNVCYVLLSASIYTIYLFYFFFPQCVCVIREHRQSAATAKVERRNKHGFVQDKMHLITYRP